MLREPVAGASGEETARNLEESAKLCKEALLLDAADGKAWLGLGSTYLRQFLSVTFRLAELRKALNAYKKAETFKQLRDNPDLYRNRAIVHCYLENYALSVADHLRAAELDPVGVGPDSVEQARSIEAMMLNVVAAIGSGSSDTANTTTSADIPRGSGIPSALAAGAAGVPAPPPPPPPPPPALPALTEVDGIDSVLCDAGNVQGGTTAPEERFARKAVRVKILRELNCPLSRLFVAADKAGFRVVVTLYNVSSNAVTVGDELLVASPYVRNCEFAGPSGTPSSVVRLLRVDRPWLIAVNGKVFGRATAAAGAPLP
ncbi:hypothetical protein DFJ73DRAFT_30761 [Zopfochytrium polystomum]|nr:hypothetical protein DFJ73DRAFT_30761 [Zopfochytrium polystomum]